MAEQANRRRLTASVSRTILAANAAAIRIFGGVQIGRRWRRIGFLPDYRRPAHWTAGVRSEPLVDAGNVEGVVAVRQQTHRIFLLQFPQTHDALCLIDAVAFHRSECENRNCLEDFVVNAGGRRLRGSIRLRRRGVAPYAVLDQQKVVGHYGHGCDNYTEHGDE